MEIRIVKNHDIMDQKKSAKKPVFEDEKLNVGYIVIQRTVMFKDPF